MGSHENRGAVRLQVFEQLREFITGLGVEPGGGLIQQQRGGLLGQRNSDTHLLPHALGIGFDRLIESLVLQAYPIKETAKLIVAVVMAAQAGEVGEILDPGQAAVEHHLLGDIGQVLLGLNGVFSNVQAIHPGLTRGGIDEVQKQIDGGGLAGTIGAQQTIDIPGIDPHIQILERFVIPVALT